VVPVVACLPARPRSEGRGAVAVVNRSRFGASWTAVADSAVGGDDAEAEEAGRMEARCGACTCSAAVEHDGREVSTLPVYPDEDRGLEGRRGHAAPSGDRSSRENVFWNDCEAAGVRNRGVEMDDRHIRIGDVTGATGAGDEVADARGGAASKHPPLRLALVDDEPAYHVAVEHWRRAQREREPAGMGSVTEGRMKDRIVERECGDQWRRKMDLGDDRLAKLCRLLPSVLVCHSRGRSLDMISPALRICIQPARARLALAGRPVRPKPEQKETRQG